MKKSQKNTKIDKKEGDFENFRFVSAFFKSKSKFKKEFNFLLLFEKK